MYKLTNTDKVILNGHTSISPTSWRWGAYQKWLADGNTPEPAEKPPTPTAGEIQKAAEVAAGVTDAAWVDALREQAVSGKTDKIDALTQKVTEIKEANELKQ